MSPVLHNGFGNPIHRGGGFAPPQRHVAQPFGPPAYQKVEPFAQPERHTLSPFCAPIEPKIPAFSFYTSIDVDDFDSRAMSERITAIVEANVSGLFVKIGPYETKISQLETSIQQNADNITLKANSTDVYTKTDVDGKISQEVVNRNSAIAVASENILSTVSANYATSSDVDDIDTRLESAESTISQMPGSIMSQVAGQYSTKSETVTSVVTEYAVGDDAVTAPTTGWSTSTPTWQAGKYIWQRTVTTKNGQTTTTNATCIQGAQGPQGIQGPKGDTGDTGPQGATGATGNGVDDITAIAVPGGIEVTITDDNGRPTTFTVPQGPQGQTGPTGLSGDSGYVHFAWSNSSSDWSKSNSEGKAYLGVCTNNTESDANLTYNDYRWTLIKGPKGDTGATGATGPTGATGATGAPGAIGPSARWYYGTDLNHTTGIAQLAVTETPDVLVGAMYLNPYLSYVYRCTAVGDPNATWEYAGNIAEGVIDQINFTQIETSGNFATSFTVHDAVDDYPLVLLTIHGDSLSNLDPDDSVDHVEITINGTSVATVNLHDEMLMGYHDNGELLLYDQLDIDSAGNVMLTKRTMVDNGAIVPISNQDDIDVILLDPIEMPTVRNGDVVSITGSTITPLIYGEWLTSLGAIVSDAVVKTETITKLKSDIVQTDADIRFDFGEQVETIRRAVSSNGTDIADLQDTIDNYNGWFTFSTYDDGQGDPAAPIMTLGSSQTSKKLEITNSTFEFKDGNTVVAYIHDGAFMMQSALIIQTMELGNFAWVNRHNGNVALKKVR